MNEVFWKKTLIQNKDHCNTLVLAAKKENRKFSDELFANNLDYFYGLLTNISLDEATILELFGDFLSLFQKNFFESGSKDFLFGCFQLLLKKINTQHSTILKYLINADAKLSINTKELFYKRLLYLSESISSTNDLLSILAILLWASGKPEMRVVALSEYLKLNANIQKICLDTLKISVANLEKDFPDLDPKNATQVLFRIIPGFVLFGGNFKSLPKIHKLANTIYAYDGSDHFEVFVDAFGTSLFYTTKLLEHKTNTEPSEYWKLILNKKLNVSEITSVVCENSHCIVSLKNSYNLYLFYLGDKK
ncbi:hypothetical protein P3G55_15800 [Leptospira sp. 96542]|nr:hypothetical protein [Leptospira sp. 96542]